jgi:predicted nucleic acid-binding protein
MYLVDTNIWLERLLEQERWEEVRDFLDAFPSDYFSITDFAFHSIGIALCKLKKKEKLLQNFYRKMILCYASIRSAMASVIHKIWNLRLQT